MPTYSKIPKRLFGTATACGYWCVFDVGLLTAGRIITKLEKIEGKEVIPLVGYFKEKGRRIYYCRYGFVNDPDIYR